MWLQNWAVKVVGVASEGVDLKYIREIHIMDPWHHLNMMEQAAGRGIRQRSHFHLPKNRWTLSPREITINYGEPIDPNIYDSLGVNGLLKHTEQEMKRLTNRKFEDEC